jgi:hypothetical protein
MKKVIVLIVSIATFLFCFVLDEKDTTHSFYMTRHSKFFTGAINEVSIRGFIGLVILILIAIFVLTINVIIIPFDIARKPIRNFIYKQKRKKNKHHKTLAKRKG